MPKTDKIDFEDDDFLQDPHPVYRSLRESDPLYFCRDVNGWVLTRHADVHKVLRDSRAIRPQAGDMLFSRIPSDIRAGELAEFGQALPGADPVRVALAGRDATMAFCSYLHGLIEVRRQSPRPDLLSELIAVTDGEHKLTEDELVVFVLVLLIAGLETTSQYI